MITINDLRDSLPKLWEIAPKRLDDGIFVRGHIAQGQCGPTSLVVQRLFGGSIVCTVASNPETTQATSTHYYNILPDGLVVDLTKGQFRDGVDFSPPEYKSGNGQIYKDYLLSLDQIVRRYRLLCEQLNIKPQ